MTTGENVFKAFEILIVDDNIETLLYMEDIFKNAGYDVTCKENGEEGLMAVKTGNFDLILLDIIMQRMNGFEVCKQLKADPNTRDIPVIFLTIMSGPDNIAKGYKQGAVDYITKPIIKIQLLTKIISYAQSYR